MKKFVINGIFLALLFTMMSVAGESNTMSWDVWEYQENDTGLTITFYRSDEMDVMIPETINGMTVTALAPELFKNNIKIQSITIPDSVTAIGAGAFQNCTALKEVRLPNFLQRIPDRCFQYCTSLERINIPESVTYIALEAFSNCTVLSEISIPSKVTFLGARSFDNCQFLSSVSIPASVNNILNDAFRDTPFLKSQSDEFVFLGNNVLVKYQGNAVDVEIPEGTTYISNAFEGNTVIESVTVPGTVGTIGVYAFRDAVNLRNVNISEGVKRIFNTAFRNCRSLVNIDLPESLTLIEQSAFRDCERLQSLTFPVGVTKIYDRVAANCPALREVRLPDGVKEIAANAFADSPNVQLLVSAGTTTEATVKEAGLTYSYKPALSGDYYYAAAGNGVEILRYIGDLYEADIPAAINGQPVTSIAAAAFQGNSYVRSITLPLTVEHIGDWAFSYMDSLEKVTLPAGLKSLGASVFTGDVNLAEIRIPQALQQIGELPFDEDAQTMICAARDSVAEAQLLAMGYTVYEMSACSPDETQQMVVESFTGGGTCEVCKQFLSNESGEMIVIPDGLTEITAGMLSGLGNELILVIPDSVTAIDPEILTGRVVKFFAHSGTYAETFARQYKLKFIVWIELNR